MLDPSAFHDLVSGRRRGPLASASRGALRGAESIYTAAIGWRNRRFDAGHAVIYNASVPVVSVGNLTLGGTGKTPMVRWLARRLRARDLRVAIISRGYRADESGRNDEALELAQSLPDVPHLQNPDRVEAARTAIDKFDTQIIVLDDGFQHRRLARDLDIVLIDALEPFGFDHVFPRGLLREPVRSLARADVVGLTRADLVDRAARKEIRQRVVTHAGDALWVETSHVPTRLITAGEETQALDLLSERRVAAFCGIGNPEGFLGTLRSAGCDPIGFRSFPDHHAYAVEDIDSLATWAGEIGAEMLVCTVKDLVKIDTCRIGETQLWAVAIDLEISEGATELESLLDRVDAAD